MKYLKLTWSDIENACINITKKIKDSKIPFDTIVSIGRGGMIPARLLSDCLSISQVYLFNVKLYRGINQKNSSVSKEFFQPNIQKKHVLLVDDLMDSGETIEATFSDFNTRGCSDLQIATILCKNHVTRRPSYYDIVCDKEDWVIFPWEKTEFKDCN